MQKERKISMEIRNNYHISKQPNFNGCPSRDVKYLIKSARDTDLRTITANATKNGIEVDESELKAVIEKSKEIANDLDEFMKPFHPETILNILVYHNENLVSFSNPFVKKFLNKHNFVERNAKIKYYVPDGLNEFKDTEPLRTLHDFDMFIHRLKEKVTPKDVDNKFLDMLIDEVKSLFRRETIDVVSDELKQVDTFSKAIGEKRGTKEVLGEVLNCDKKNKMILEKYINMT